ncbi:MAG: NirF protein [Nitrospirae bacterium]|nr:NirF protein [Nitrospirota bacterium]
MYYLIVFIMYFLTVDHAFAEKLYVVEREREGVAVIEDNKLKEIGNLGNMNHTTVKFDNGYAYVVGRDGFFSKIDIKTDTLVKRINVGKSGIGFTFCKDYIAIANYDPKDVVIVDKSLNKIKTIETDSRNVGIKCKDSLLVFSLMDKDEVHVIDVDKDFKQVKVVKTKGQMPFDALLYGDVYIAGFFKGGIGIINMKNLEYTETIIEAGDLPTFKIPHFGTWGVTRQRAYIPAVGDRKLQIVDMKSFKYTGAVELIGLPVFVVLSPDDKYLAVNYSGDKEDYITIIDLKDNTVVKNIEAGKRIMHLRFSNDGKTLFVSSYFDNMMKKIDRDTWSVKDWMSVPTPSGVFIAN